MHDEPGLLMSRRGGLGAGCLRATVMQIIGRQFSAARSSLGLSKEGATHRAVFWGHGLAPHTSATANLNHQPFFLACSLNSSANSISADLT